MGKPPKHPYVIWKTQSLGSGTLMWSLPCRIIPDRLILVSQGRGKNTTIFPEVWNTPATGDPGITAPLFPPEALLEIVWSVTRLRLTAGQHSETGKGVSYGDLGHLLKHLWTQLAFQKAGLKQGAAKPGRINHKLWITCSFEKATEGQMLTAPDIGVYQTHTSEQYPKGETRDKI